MTSKRFLPFVVILFSIVNGHAQTATTVRNAHVRQYPDGDSPSRKKLDVGATLKLLLDHDTLSYYHVSTSTGETGYVYRTLVRLSNEDPAWWTGDPASGDTENGILNACSFNIKFLGSSKGRENHKLVDLLAPYDLVIVQELVAPPYDGFYPRQIAYKGDLESAAFFDLMHDNGFEYFLSNEDTGKKINHSASSQSEWFVVFYRDEVLKVDSTRCEFISSPLVANSVFDRVPFRFQFSTTDGTFDFSIIDVHLASEEAGDEQRKSELEAITAYARSNWLNEKDFLVVGDMNIQDDEEYAAVIPQGWTSLNDECRTTNVAASKNRENQKPYDHVVYYPAYTSSDIDLEFDMEVVDIFVQFYHGWAAQNPNSASSRNWVNSFGPVYSDHHPVTFKLKYGVADDD